MNLPIFRGLWLGVPTFFLASLAWAYILPSSFLLEKLCEKRAQFSYQRLKVTMQCQKTSGQDILYLMHPGLVRRERADGSVDICRNGQCVRKCPEKSKQTKLEPWSYLPYLYFVEASPARSRYEDLLQSLNIKTNVNTMNRLAGRVAVVLGAKPWEQDRAQFWIDKDLFLPLRLMVLDMQALMDIQWTGWGSKAGGDWFPAKLKIQKDGEVLENCEITQVDSKEKFSDSLFQP